MRKVIVAVNLTADGFLCGPDGELDWMMVRPDPEMNIAVTDALRTTVDTMLVGHTTHLAFEQNFQAHIDDPHAPAALVDFARWMVETPKVVISRTISEIPGQNVTVTADPGAAIDALRQQRGGDIVAFGGVETLQTLVGLDLVDEYRIKSYPVAIGAGRALFTRPVALDLVDSIAHASGILTLTYTPVRSA